VRGQSTGARAALLTVLAVYTAFAAGPFAWIAVMSLRTTSEILDAPYAWPATFHWWKYGEAWFGSNYGIYFRNSTMISIVAVSVLCVVGAMAAHCLARYHFPGRRTIYLLILSTIIFPPQITIISLFQVLGEYGLLNTLTGLTLVYIATQLPLTVYILEGFFRRIPQDLFDAARLDGYSDIGVFWRIAVPIGAPAVATTVILNLIYIWNEFLFAVVLLTDDDKRTLPLGIQAFLGDHLEDVGMLATGMMIAVVPVILVYVFFSERMIRGMTEGAVR
jgi:ABC-type glycerol-3-phosphate transport system permease component